MKLLYSFLLVLALVSASPARAQEKSVNEIYSAMVFNFLKYIQWPDEASSTDFMVGIYGDSEVLSTMEQLYKGKSKGTRKFQIQNLEQPGDADKYQVIFVGKSKSRDLAELKKIIGEKPTLIISIGDGLCKKGSMINFVQVDGKLKFELNESATAKASLKVSSALTSLAIII